MVGTVYRTSFSFSLSNIAVLPAASSPTIRMVAFFFENSVSNQLRMLPINKMTKNKLIISTTYNVIKKEQNKIKQLEKESTL